jgi:hypothetical protein
MPAVPSRHKCATTFNTRREKASHNLNLRVRIAVAIFTTKDRLLNNPV